jgi:hypothetical protein
MVDSCPLDICLRAVTEGRPRAKGGLMPWLRRANDLI